MLTVASEGEYSDFQYISDLLDQLMTEEYCTDDGARLYPRELWNYLVRVMYARRSKFDPLWNQLVVSGFRDGKSFLGVVDMHGPSPPSPHPRELLTRGQAPATRTTRRPPATAPILLARS